VLIFAKNYKCVKNTFAPVSLADTAEKQNRGSRKQVQKNEKTKKNKK
jgi:hypothetical protein